MISSKKVEKITFGTFESGLFDMRIQCSVWVKESNKEKPLSRLLAQINFTTNYFNMMSRQSQENYGTTGVFLGLEQRYVCYYISNGYVFRTAFYTIGNPSLIPNFIPDFVYIS
jgi:hypothetical protein